jgi:hypothetical protein
MIVLVYDRGTTCSDCIRVGDRRVDNLGDDCVRILPPLG